MARSSQLIARSASAAVPGPEQVARQLGHLRDGTCDLADGVLTVDPAVFRDPDIARREREGVFGRVPFLVAHSSELAEPGAFRRLRLPNNEALLVRQDDGSVRTFLNVCRHRGNLVESQSGGTCRAFTCPYHAWSYGRDGSLRNVTFEHTFGDVDRSAAALVELPTWERYGLIWVVDNPDASVDLDEWLGADFAASLAAAQLGEFVCVHSGSFDEPVNWKLLQDAFLDGYHIQFVHPHSAAPHFYTNRHVFEPFGNHVRFFAARKSIDRYLKPVGTGEISPAEIPIVDHVTLSRFVAPNVTLLRQPDHYQMLSFLPHPTDPARSMMEMRLIVPPEAVSGMDAQTWTNTWDRNWQILMDVLRDEDFPAIARRPAGARQHRRRDADLWTQRAGEPGVPPGRRRPGRRHTLTGAAGRIRMIQRVATPTLVLGRLRAMVANLAGAVEYAGAAGLPVWRVGRRSFLNVATVGSAADAVTVITVRAEDYELAALAATGRPFFRPRSANARGWIGLVVDDASNWDEIAELIAESHRLARLGPTSGRA